MRQGRVLVTGASGFLGRHLVPHLASAGRQLTLAGRTDAGTAGHRAVRVAAIDGRTDWSEALDGVTAVVHAAGRAHQLRDTDPDPDAAYGRVNRDGTLRLAEAALQRGVRGFLFLSTLHVLGTASPPGRPFTDATPPAPPSAYARSKAEAEAGLAALFAGRPESLVVLRPPLLVGPGMKGNLERLLRLVRRPLPLPFGAIRNRRTLLSADALSDAIATVLRRWDDAPASGTFVVGDRAAASTTEIVRALRDGARGAARLVPVPEAALRAAFALLGRHGLAERLLGDLEADSTGFRQAFGWDPPSDTLDALREAAGTSAG